MFAVLLSVVILSTEPPLDTAYYKKFVPDGHFLLQIDTGDINLDKFKNDAAIVFEREGLMIDSSYSNECHGRSLLILLQNTDGTHRQFLKQDSIIAGPGCGGWFDPLEGIEIDRGRLALYHYGGLGWRWRRDRVYKWVDSMNTLMLIGVNQLSHHGSDQTHLSEWRDEEIESIPIEQDKIDSNIKLVKTRTTSEFPHRNSAEIPAHWVKTLLDTSKSEIDDDQVSNFKREMKRKKVPKSRWHEYFIALELPSYVEAGRLFVVQGSHKPYNRALQGAHAGFFYVLEGSTLHGANDHDSVRVLYSGMCDVVDVDISKRQGYPDLDVTWLFVSGVVTTKMKYSEVIGKYEAGETTKQGFGQDE